MPALDFEGRAVAVQPGDTIASALYRAGVRTFSRSFKNHRPRGLYCLSGDCPNCAVTVDGIPGVVSCREPAVAGQRVAREAGWPSADRDAFSAIGRLGFLFPVGFYYKTLARPRFAWPQAERVIRRLAGRGHAPLGQDPASIETENHHPDLLVVGGGAAGLAAALAAVEAGERVLLCDEGEPAEGLGPGPTRAAVEDLASRLAGSEGARVLRRAAAIGIYEGPFVVVRTKELLHLVHPERVVVATGAVERHCVYPGNDLPGVWLARGAARMAAVHGVPPGRKAVLVTDTHEGIGHAEALLAAGMDLVALVAPEPLAAAAPDGVTTIPDGEVVEAAGRRHVTRVKVRRNGTVETLDCDTLVLALSPVPRDGLLRQGTGLPVSGAGEVVRPGLPLQEAIESGRQAALGAPPTALPDEPAAPPVAGCLCLCEDVSVGDLERAWDEGFRSTELLKRYTTATMGPCQGALCHGPLRGFVAARSTGTRAASAATTARPPARPITLEEAAAGVRQHLEMRTALHETHVAGGATMEWAGAWKRPESYGDTLAEYWAVRTGVSVMDVGTLGKFDIGGPDALEFLERLYPCNVHDLESGRLRYSLLLNEAGYVLDDGVVCAFGAGRYFVTLTSGGAEQGEAWLRDWADTWGLAVHIANRTAALGAINLAGPRARDVLSRVSSVGTSTDLAYLHHADVEVAGVPCRVIRLGFVGEISYELHHPSSQSRRLWSALLEAGADFGARPHGLEALRLLRLEKAHIIVGQDTDFDSTPAKLGLDWAVKPEKDSFVGKVALARLARIPLDRKLVGFAFEGADAPVEGSPLTAGGRHAGHLTSCRHSPVLGHAVALGWLREVDGSFPTEVEAGGRAARIVSGAFYDPAGERLRA